jgi:hypothetical protein
MFTQQAPLQMRCSRNCNKKSWYQRSPLNRAKAKATEAARQMRIRMECFEAYGGAYCQCCNEDRWQLLTLDHINGSGTKERQSIGQGPRFYRWLSTNGYPPGYRVLCMNCNHSHGLRGYCPHDIDRVVASLSLPC